MKIFENITNGYRKIASGIAIVAFLALLYFALIPGGTMAAVYSATGVGIPNAFVKLVDYPQYNTTTSSVIGHEGEYSIPNVPYDGIAGGSTYLIRAKATGYAINTTTVFVNGDVSKEIVLSPGVAYIASGQAYAGQWRTDFRVGNLGNQPTTLDTNFINLLGITKNSSEDYISSMTSKDYLWSENIAIPFGDVEGSGTVTSEQPIDVITMQRSNSPGKLGFFEGIAINPAGTQWFVPGLVFGGQWRSGFKVLNLGDTAATVNMKFYNSVGIELNNVTVSVPSKASPYYDWYTYGYLPSGSSANEGTATVTSNSGQPINVIASQASELNGKLGFWNGINQNDQKTEVFATGMAHAGQWRTAFKVANIGSSAANVWIYFYNTAGVQINQINVNIEPKASSYYDWYTYGLLPSGSTALEGTAKIVSTNSIPVYVVESQASESPGILDFYQSSELNGNTTAGLIYMKFENGERSGFKIANPADTPISATMKFYNASGVLVNTITIPSIAAKSSPYYAWNTYTTEPSGSVTVEATGRISVTASIASETEAKLGIFKGIKQ